MVAIRNKFCEYGVYINNSKFQIKILDVTIKKPIEA